MKIFVKAKPNSKEEKIEKIGEFNFLISVKEPPIQGKANKAIIKKISEYLSIPIQKITLISGFSSKNKVFEIKNIN